MTNLQKYFGFRYSNNRKMFSRNRIKRAPAVAREGCGGSGAPGAGLRGARGRRCRTSRDVVCRVSRNAVCRTSRSAVCRVSRSAVCGFPGTPFGPLFGAIRGSFARLFRAGPGQVSGHIFGHVPGYIFGALFGTHPKRIGTGKRGGTRAAARSRLGRRMKPAQTPMHQPIGSRRKRPAGPQPNNS